MEIKWTIERRPGAFASDPYYYIVRRNGKFVMAFDKKKDAKEYIEIYGEGLEEMRKAILKGLE